MNARPKRYFFAKLGITKRITYTKAYCSLRLTAWRLGHETPPFILVHGRNKTKDRILSRKNAEFGLFLFPYRLCYHFNILAILLIIPPIFCLFHGTEKHIAILSAIAIFSAVMPTIIAPSIAFRCFRPAVLKEYTSSINKSALSTTSSLPKKLTSICDSYSWKLLPVYSAGKQVTWLYQGSPQEAWIRIALVDFFCSPLTSSHFKDLLKGIHRYLFYWMLPVWASLLVPLFIVLFCGGIGHYLLDEKTYHDLLSIAFTQSFLLVPYIILFIIQETKKLQYWVSYTDYDLRYLPREVLYNFFGSRQILYKVSPTIARTLITAIYSIFTVLIIVAIGAIIQFPITLSSTSGNLINVTTKLLFNAAH